MNHRHSPLSRLARRRTRGFTLVELMIAITVALFLIAGMLYMVQSTRAAFGTQNQLAQLQDNERLVMTFMAEVVESAGYFPDPVHNVATTVMPAVAGVFTTAGQSIAGVHNATAQGDTLTVRYGAGPNDNVFNCAGTTNKTALVDTFVNQFSVDNKGQLLCTYHSNVTTTPVVVPLVSGGTNLAVTNLQVRYGIKRNATDTGSCADTYVDASLMAAADWLNVCSINLLVTFTNPLKAGGTGPATITIQRVVAVMNAAGVNT